jgi:hypothetical protein
LHRLDLKNILFTAIFTLVYSYVEFRKIKSKPYKERKKKENMENNPNQEEDMNASRGEQLIINFLKKNNIDYIREYALALTYICRHTKKQKVGIWYPDFYLPEFGIIVEYFGGAYVYKKEAYDNNKINYIGLYRKHGANPELLEKELKEELLKISRKRLEKAEKIK